MLLKLTQYSTRDEWEDGKCEITDVLTDVYLSVGAIQTVSMHNYYRGEDHRYPDVAATVPKVMITFGNENYVIVNEDLDTVLASIPE